MGERAALTSKLPSLESRGASSVGMGSATRGGPGAPAEARHRSVQGEKLGGPCPHACYSTPCGSKSAKNLVAEGDLDEVGQVLE